MGGDREKRLRAEDRERELARRRAVAAARLRGDDRVGKATWETPLVPHDVAWELRAQAFDDTLRAALATPQPTALAQHADTMAAVSDRRAATLYRRAIEDGTLDGDSDEIAAALAKVGAGGAALPDGLRVQLERELGASFAHVRIHTDGLAAAAATAARAHAFTVGEDIFFADGAYDPDSRGGRALIAHELAHVVQAQQGRTGRHGGGVSHAGDPLEREADAVAERAVAQLEQRADAGLGGAPAPGLAVSPRAVGPRVASVASASGEPGLAVSPRAVGPSVASVASVASASPKLLRKGVASPTAPLPATAGGKRLDRPLDGDPQWNAEFLAPFETGPLSALDTAVATKLPHSPSVQPAFANAVSDGQRIDNALADPSRKQTVLHAFRVDLAALVIEQVLAGTIDVAALTADAAKIGRTYVRFATDERDGRLGAVHPSGAGSKNAGRTFELERRASQFHAAALAKLGASTDRARDVLAGLAADADAFETGDADAALQGGRALVAQLLETADLAGLRDLYHTVLDDLFHRANTNAAALAHVLDAHLADLVVAPIQAVLAAAGTSKQHAINFLARECGDFLARLDPGNLAALIRAHLTTLDIVAPSLYGAAIVALPADVGDQLVRAEGEATADAARAQQQQPAAPTHTPAPTGTAKPGRTPTKKPLDAAELAAWLRAYFTDRKAFDAKHLDLGTAENDAAAHAAARRVLGLLDRHLASARQRDATIAKLRGGEPSVMPDYVGFFGIASKLYTQLDRLLDGRPLDVAGMVEWLNPMVLAHFGALAHYQGALVKALGTAQKAKTSAAGKHVATHYADSFALDTQHLAAIARDAKQLPGWTVDGKTLARADALSGETQRSEEILGRADVELEAQRTARIEADVYARAPREVADLWARRDAAARETKITPDELWAKVKPLLATLDRKGDEAIARGFIEQIVDDANATRLEGLKAGATAALLDTDTLVTEQQVARAKALAAELRGADTPAPAGDPLDKLLELAKGETQNLVTIYAMTDIALAGSAGDWGDHMRAANLLKLALGRGNATLHTAYGYLKKHEVEITAELQGAIMAERGQGPVTQQFLEGTDKELFHKFMTNPVMMQGLLGLAFHALDKSRAPNQALGMLMAVEEAGGGIARRGKVAEIADRLGDKGGSQGYATAKFVYAFALDALDLLDKGVREEIAKETKKAGKEDKTPSRDSAVASFDKGIHPRTQAPLTPQERTWWSKYKKITGDGNIVLPGKEGWAKAGDFVKQLVTMLALAWVTGGLAAGAAEMASLSAAGEFLVEVGLFTEGMRFAEEVKSGQRSEHGFAHDFLVNAAMMGMPRLAVKGFGRLFTTPTSLLGKAAFKAGEFAAEYVAASAVNLVDLAMTKGVLDISADDLKEAAWSNFAFIAAFKGVAVLGAAGTKGIDRAFKNVDPHDAALQALDAKLEAIDKQLAKDLKATLKLKDSAAQRDALAKQKQALEAKLKHLEDSNIPRAREVADQYRAGIEAYAADIARADTMIAIGAEPIAGTPDFKYEGGPGAEARLMQHFLDSGASVKVTEGLGGKIFEISAGGGKVRFTPGEMLEGAGSQKGLYAKSGRIEQTRLDKPADVMKVLNASPARSHLIPDNAPAAFLVVSPGGGARAMVSIKPVDAHSIKSTDHAAGPAVMHASFKQGMFHVEIEVLRDTSNDQVVRSVNHELIEIEQFLDKAMESVGHDTKKLADKFKDQKQVDALMRDEAAGSATKKGSTSKDVSAHDVGVLNGDVHTLGLQLEELVTLKRDPKLTHEQLALVDQRIELLREDMSKVWTSLGMPEDKVALDKRLDAFEQAGGIRLSHDARAQLQIMRAGKADLAGVGRMIGVIEIKIAFAELHKSNPITVEGATYLDLMEYYQDKIATKVEVEMSKVMTDTGGDVAAARAKGLEVIRDLAGGTSIASWRGRAFEGLGIEEWNKDPSRVADRGRAYAVEPNNFPTYDAVCIKGAEPPFTFEVEDGRLKIKDKSGKRIYGEYEKSTYLKPGVEIWKASMKAKSKADPVEMSKALGSPDDPTGHGMIVTPEYMADLKATIAEAEAAAREAQRAADEGEGKQSAADQAKTLADTLSWYAGQIEVSKKWSNERIDAMLEALKDAGIDTKNLRANLPKVHP